MADKVLIKKYKRTHQTGQSIIEMALLLPVMLVLVVMALEFGRVFFTKIVITNAAREAAYYLSVNPSEYNGGSAQNAVLVAQTEASNSGVPNISVSITPKSSYGGEQSVEITVTTDLQDFHMLNLINNTFAISGTQHEFFSISSTVEMMIQ